MVNLGVTSGVNDPAVIWDSASERYVVSWTSDAGAPLYTTFGNLADVSTRGNVERGSIPVNAGTAGAGIPNYATGNAIAVSTEIADALKVRFGRIVNTGVEALPGVEIEAGEEIDRRRPAAACRAVVQRRLHRHAGDRLGCGIPCRRRRDQSRARTGHRHDQASAVRHAVRRRAGRPVGLQIRLERSDEVPDDRDRRPQPQPGRSGERRAHADADRRQHRGSVGRRRARRPQRRGRSAEARATPMPTAG